LDYHPVVKRTKSPQLVYNVESYQLLCATFLTSAGKTRLAKH